MIVEGHREPIHGIVGKNENYYVIRNKESHEFYTESGELDENIMRAGWFSSFILAKQVRSTFDEPKEFEIILMSCTTMLEEVLA